MDIQLSPGAQRFIEAQLESGAYHSVSDVIEALIRARAPSQVAGNGPGPSPSDKGAKQRAMILQVIRECEILAGAPLHDRILYGERQ